MKLSMTSLILTKCIKIIAVVASLFIALSIIGLVLSKNKLISSELKEIITKL